MVDEVEEEIADWLLTEGLMADEWWQHAAKDRGML